MWCCLSFVQSPPLFSTLRRSLSSYSDPPGWSVLFMWGQNVAYGCHCCVFWYTSFRIATEPLKAIKCCSEKGTSAGNGFLSGAECWFREAALKRKANEQLRSWCIIKLKIELLLCLWMLVGMNVAIKYVIITVVPISQCTRSLWNPFKVGSLC